MARLVLDEERCKGCQLCTVACPKKLLKSATRFNSNGYHPVECLDQKKCNGCALCAICCPDIAIEIYK